MDLLSDYFSCGFVAEEITSSYKTFPMLLNHNCCTISFDKNKYQMTTVIFLKNNSFWNILKLKEWFNVCLQAHFSCKNFFWAMYIRQWAVNFVTLRRERESACSKCNIYLLFYTYLMFSPLKTIFYFKQSFWESNENFCAKIKIII